MHVVYTKLDSAAASRLGSAEIERLPLAYRDRWRRMRDPMARARTLAGLALLGRALSDRGRDRAALARIGHTATGRPVITGLPDFSIAHSHVLVACALGDGEAVGLDVEQLHATAPARLRARLGAPGGADFYEAWCAREAVVKASGRVGLARIQALALQAGCAQLDGRQWLLTRLDLDPDYAAWLASDAPVGPVTTQSVPPGALSV